MYYSWKRKKKNEKKVISIQNKAIVLHQKNLKLFAAFPKSIFERVRMHHGVQYYYYAGFLHLIHTSASVSVLVCMPVALTAVWHPLLLRTPHSAAINEQCSEPKKQAAQRCVLLLRAATTVYSCTSVTSSSSTPSSHVYSNQLIITSQNVCFPSLPIVTIWDLFLTALLGSEK